MSAGYAQPDIRCGYLSAVLLVVQETAGKPFQPPGFRQLGDKAGKLWLPREAFQYQLVAGIEETGHYFDSLPGTDRCGTPQNGVEWHGLNHQGRLFHTGVRQRRSHPIGDDLLCNQGPAEIKAGNK